MEEEEREKKRQEDWEKKNAGCRKRERESGYGK